MENAMMKEDALVFLDILNIGKDNAKASYNHIRLNHLQIYWDRWTGTVSIRFVACRYLDKWLHSQLVWAEKSKISTAACVQFPELVSHVGWAFCWFTSLLRGFSPAPRVFLRVLRFSHGSFGFPAGPPVFLRVLRFSSLHKNEYSKFQLDMDGHSGQQGPPCGVSIAESHHYCYYFYNYYCYFYNNRNCWLQASSTLLWEWLWSMLSLQLSLLW